MDSGLSSCSNDTVSLNDFSPPPVLSLYFFVEKKIKQVEQVAEHIKQSKKDFFEKYDEMNKKIEYLMKQLYCRAEQKKGELTNQLEEIATTQILSYDSQLNICEKAEDWLKNIKIDLAPGSEFLQETCNMYSRDILFIDSPEIIFDESSDSVENCSENIGVESSPTMSVNNHAEKMQPKFCLGSKGQNVGEFNRPWGLCSDRAGRILVADCLNNRIQVFNEQGMFLLKFGKFGAFPGYFNKPVGITVDEKSRILVTDQNNHRVQVFTFNGKFIFMFGQKGYRPGQFQYPWDVDTNSVGEIAISDTENHRVQLFNENGLFVSEFRFENCIQRIVCPLGVAFKPDDTLLVTDIKSSIIFKIDKAFSTATKVIEFMNFHSPQGIACSSYGKLIIADSKNNKIQVFDEEGKFHSMFGKEGKSPGEFDNPQGVCFHPNGSIAVTEFGNNRIQLF